MNAPNQLDFLPDDYLASKARARINRLCGSLLAIVILSVAGAFAFSERALDQLKQDHADLLNRYDLEAARIQKLDQLQKQQDAIAKRAQLSAALIEKLPRTAVLTEIHSLLPASATLLETSLASKLRPAPVPKVDPNVRRGSPEKEKQPAPEPKLFDVTLKLVGIAPTDAEVAAFIGALTRSPIISEANLLLSLEYDYRGQSLRRFEIELCLRDQPLPTADANASVATDGRATDR